MLSSIKTLNFTSSESLQYDISSDFIQQNNSSCDLQGRETRKQGTQLQHPECLACKWLQRWMFKILPWPNSRYQNNTSGSTRPILITVGPASGLSINISSEESFHQQGINYHLRSHNTLRSPLVHLKEYNEWMYWILQYKKRKGRQKENNL